MGYYCPMSPTPPPGPARGLLLLGPTGSGKTPQGRLVARLPRCHHFDFGAHLRAAVAGAASPLSPPEVAFVRGLLDAHQVLPSDRFDIARRLLAAFLAEAGCDPERDLVVLNGLPRTASQAHDIAPLVQVRLVVVLECSPRAAAARVARRRQGEGSDDAGREDDDPRHLPAKLQVHRRHTAPLLALYHAQGVPVLTVAVAADTHDEALHRLLVGELARRGLLPQAG